MHFVGCRLGRQIAPALLGDNVQQHRPDRLGGADLRQHVDEILHVVSVDGPDVVEPELLEQRRARPADHAPRVLVDLGGRRLDRLGQLLGHPLGNLPQLPELPVGLQTRQRSRKRTHRLLVLSVVLCRQRHLLVVVQHDNHVRVEEPGVVHRLVGHASGDGTVTDHGDAAVVPVLSVPAHGHAQRRRDARRAVSRPKRVVRRLGPLGESREPSRLTNRRHFIAPARQNLVNVRLVTHVKDDLVVRRVEHVVQRHGQLHHAQTRSQVPSRLRNGMNKIRPQLLAQLLELRPVEVLDVHRIVDRVEQRRRRAVVLPRVQLVHGDLVPGLPGTGTGTVPVCPIAVAVAVRGADGRVARPAGVPPARGPSRNAGRIPERQGPRLRNGLHD